MSQAPALREKAKVNTMAYAGSGLTDIETKTESLASRLHSNGNAATYTPDEEAFQSNLMRYHALVDRDFLGQLTEAEQREMECLGQEIDAANTPLYAQMFAPAPTNE